MKVLTSTRQMAVFQVVRDLVCDEPSIELDEFIAHWPRTGLRGSDCAIAVVEMLRERFMVSRQRSSRRYLELTESGLAAYHASDESLVRQVNDGLVLLRARHRQDWLLQPRRPSRHRRQDDPPLARRRTIRDGPMLRNG